MTKKRVFISFAIEDSNLRDFLVGQSRNPGTPFEFIDMSVKQPWDSAWKTNCRTKIRGCDGLIAIVTNNTRNASGQLWEISCAKEEGIPVRAVWGHHNEQPNISELAGVKTVYWSWDNIANWIATL